MPEPTGEFQYHTPNFVTGLSHRYHWNGHTLQVLLADTKP
jgi:hypothetical protein